jgi:hypothetical protein
MASKFTWLIGKRGVMLAIAALVTVVLGFSGHAVHSYGLWDGPG